MISVIDIEEFLENTGNYPIVDVRTPAEFDKGHIPGAINLPLFTDEQRVVVGTLYKQKGKIPALLKGLDYVGPRMSELLSRGMELAGSHRQLFVHCWRGGQRSESMAWLFSRAGIECTLLRGGYKSYRTYILDRIAQLREVIVVGGMTGSGKTEILKIIESRGEQVIDLEGLANHRGSAFGAIGMPPQPSSEHFANLLYDRIRQLDIQKRIFVEDESLNIGSVFMPEEFYRIIRNSRVYALISSPEVRLPRLLSEYGIMDQEELIKSVSKIRKRLGNKNTDDAIEAIKSGNMAFAISLVLEYYDRTYRFGLSRRDKSLVKYIETASADASFNAGLLMGAAGK